MIRWNFLEGWREEAAERGIELTDEVSEVIGAYAGEKWDPSEGLDFLEAIQALRSSDTGGRHRARADIAEPDWWPFYFEQAVRGLWGDAQGIRTSLGLSAPLAGGVPELARFVAGVIEQTGMPESGMHIDLECLDASWPAERLAYTLHLGSIDREQLGFYLTAPEHHAAKILDMVVDSVHATLPESPYVGRYAALVKIAFFGMFESMQSTSSLGLGASQVTQYILCDWMPDPPQWMTWERTGGHFNTGVTLHIPSLVATPEQVRTLYTQARESIAARFPGAGCPIPQAVTEERMRAVRYIEENAARLAPLTWRERWEQAKADNVNLTWKDHDSLKAAYHAAVVPIRYLKTEQKGGESE